MHRGHKGSLLPLFCAACLVLGGCGDDDDDGTTAANSGDTHQLEIPAEAPDSPEALTAEPVEGDFQGVSYEAYDEAVTELLYLLDDYWTEALPEEFDVEYSSPSDVIAYYPEEGAPKCGGETLGPENAFYCPGNDIIAWDEPGLFIPFYEEVGDAAIGFVLGHEWGHLIQNRLEAEFPITIEQELNADCLSGVFAGALQDEGLLEGGESLEPGTDLYEAAVGIYDFGDAPDVHWQDPSAHGQPEERLEAFEIGYDGGAQACADELGPGFTEGA